MRMFENRVLGKVFDLKREAVTGDKTFSIMRTSWSVCLMKCHLGDCIKKNKMAGACIRYGAEERCIQWFVGET